MENLINIAVVNFNAKWGCKDVNLNKMKEMCIEAGEKKADMIIFPETALTGYDNETFKDKSKKMQYILAETIPGPSTNKVVDLAKKYNMYIIFGMPERDKENKDIIYNSAAIIEPTGNINRYRKIHLPFDEADWAVRGNEPVLIDTKWGPIGISICYDTYFFPELLRYYRAMGARMSINVTACPEGPCTSGTAESTIKAYALINSMFIASSNLCGKDLYSSFIGGSSVIGPDEDDGKAISYVGKMFNETNSTIQGLKMGIIDLSLADQYAKLPVFFNNQRIEDWDWRPELYSKIYKEASNKYHSKNNLKETSYENFYSIN